MVSDFLVQVQPTICSTAILGVLGAAYGYIRSERFRHWLNHVLGKLGKFTKWRAAKWRYNLTISIIILLEFSTYFVYADWILVIFSSLHIALFVVLMLVFRVPNKTIQ